MNRGVAVLVCLIALFVGWRVVSRSSVESSNAASPLVPSVEGSRIYFVPLGDFSAEQLDSLVEFYRQKYGLEIAVVKSVPVNDAVRDSARQQVVAEKLVAQLRHDQAKYGNDRRAILIGFTSEDLYPASQNGQFCFGWRDAEMRTAVVSTARLNLRSESAPFAEDTSETRLRKVVTKDIGVLYYGFQPSANPKSVLYKQIMGIDELDQVSEDF